MGVWAEDEAELAANKGVREDSALDLYMRAAAMEGKRESVVTDYILRILGMDVRPTMLGQDAVSCWLLSNSCHHLCCYNAGLACITDLKHGAGGLQEFCMH